ncbi:hypothetical protein MN608_10117 [Microdochium nivale]|nr:hypothetical protein MN608_10117 [Microdochium nivale]
MASSAVPQPSVLSKMHAAGRSPLETLPSELLVMVITLLDAQHDKPAIMGLALSSQTLWCRVLGEHVLRGRGGGCAKQHQQQVEEHHQGGHHHPQQSCDAVTLDEDDVDGYLAAFDGKGYAFVQSRPRRDWEEGMRAWLEMLLRGGAPGTDNAGGGDLSQGEENRNSC